MLSLAHTIAQQYDAVDDEYEHDEDEMFSGDNSPRAEGVVSTAQQTALHAMLEDSHRRHSLGSLARTQAC